MRKVMLFYIRLQSSVLSALIEPAGFSVSASTFDQLWYVVFIKVDEENPASHNYRCVVGKGRSTLLFFSDNCGSFSLMQH